VVKTTDITRVAQEYKKQNGHSRINKEDLPWYIIERVDKLHERLDDMNKTFIPKWLFIWVIGILCVVIGYVVTQVHALGGA